MLVWFHFGDDLITNLGNLLSQIVGLLFGVAINFGWLLICCLLGMIVTMMAFNNSLLSVRYDVNLL